MIRRLMFAALAIASIPAILGPQSAHSQTVPTPKTVGTSRSLNLIQMQHISVTVSGKGSPVILIPGMATPRAVWDGVAPGLAAKHRVYVVQVNGFGGDEPGANLQPGILEGIVADLHALVLQEKLKGAAVVGHSMGGLVGLMFAKEHPGDLAKLMVVDALPYFGVLMVPPGTEASVARIEPTAKGMRDGIIANYGKPADPARIAAQTRGMALKPDSQEKMKAWAAAADSRVTGQAIYEDLITDLRGQIAGISTPVTLVYPWNANSPPKELVDQFYRNQYAALPHITYVDITDAAHFVMLDQPEAFEKALDAFVN
jgi:pimeloyl-ACP methyl ester carboxylesterase